MDDQTDLHYDNSLISKSILSDTEQKHVRFADNPIVFKNVQFHFSPKLTSTEVLLQKPNESCLKNAEDYIQIYDDTEPQFTNSSIFIFLLLASFLFFIIWWTVSKLLMFEIDTQIGDHLLRQMGKQRP